MENGSDTEMDILTGVIIGLIIVVAFIQIRKSYKKKKRLSDDKPQAYYSDRR